MEMAMKTNKRVGPGSYQVDEFFQKNQGDSKSYSNLRYLMNNKTSSQGFIARQFPQEQ